MVRGNGGEVRIIIQISMRESTRMIRSEGMESLHGHLEMCIKEDIKMMKEKDLVL